MKKKLLNKKENELVDEQTSPLFRIMSLFDSNSLLGKSFANNICAFHIGNGYILSVGHNLRTQAGIPNSLSQVEYKSLLSQLDENSVKILESSYLMHKDKDTFCLNLDLNPSQINNIQLVYNSLKYDTRWLTLYKKDICQPYLVVQFRDNLFYNNQKLTDLIAKENKFGEPALFRHTFLLKLELVKGFFSDDYALYKIKEDKRLIEKLPYLKIDYDEVGTDSIIYCLQSAPSGSNLGRLLNKASVEGVLDNWSLFNDPFEGNYAMEGLRYFTKGYFRFGSSGSPYLRYDKKKNEFRVVGIQSEASPIQMMIGGSQNGNFQYINSIVSPIRNIEKRLKEIIKKKL